MATTITLPTPIAPPDADAVWLAAAREGDRDAFSELMRRHYSSALKLARSVLRDREEAEDEVQNAFTKAYLHLARFEGNSRFSTWLSRIVLNQCLMNLRRNRRTRFHYLDDAGPEQESPRLELADHAETPEEALGRREVHHVLQREIRAIPPMLREPLLLRESAKLPMAEVAARLNISEAAAKSRLLRARRELRSRLRRHEGARGMATLVS